MRTPGAANRCGADPDFADLRALEVQHRRDQAAEPQLLGIRHPAASRKDQRQQNGKTNQAHGATIREPPGAVASLFYPLALYLLSPHFLRSVKE